VQSELLGNGEHIINRILMDGLPVSQYRELTSDMFKQIYMVKDILSNQTREYEPLTDE
jgi:hypothetical protein